MKGREIGGGLCALEKETFCEDFGFSHPGGISRSDHVSCNWETCNGTHFFGNHLDWYQIKLAGNGIFRCYFTNGFERGPTSRFGTPTTMSKVKGDASPVVACLRKILQSGGGLGGEHCLPGVPTSPGLHFGAG